MMPGMGGGFSITDPFIISLFRHDLRTQFLVICALTLVTVLAGVLATYRRPADQSVEPRSRYWLRWSFGALWIIDGVLQFQVSMPLGMANQVVAPASEGAPGWLHTLIFHGIGLWNQHPLALACVTAWVQIGIGLLFVSCRGRLLRVSAVGSVAWALMIWVLGNAMGGLFSPTASILFGWPGAVLFYLIAGIWLSGPRRWFPDTFSVITLRLLAIVLGAGALLQLWPDRGFWLSGSSNALSVMGSSMSSAAQPSWLAGLVLHLSSVLGGTGPLLNIVVISWLVITARGLWIFSDSAEVWPVHSLLGGSLFFWVVAQDCGVFGGLATDVNSLLPISLLAWCAAPARRTAAPARVPGALVARRHAGLLAGSLGAAMIVAGVLPGLWSVATSAAESTLFYAQNGEYSLVRTPSPSFQLTNVNGRLFTLNQDKGHYTVLTFLDPNCWTDCSLLAAQVGQLSTELGAHSAVDFVSIAANPNHESLHDLRSFMRTHRLTKVPNFYFLTGPTDVVSGVWASYGIQVSINPGDRMSVHTNTVFIIDPEGLLRVVIPDDPVNSNSGRNSTVTVLHAALHDAGYQH
ncbi:MAG: SCO family protein [Actinomycetota bacterium]